MKKTLYLEGSSSQRLGDGALSRANNLIKRKIFLIGVIAAGCVIAIAALIPSVANGQMDNIKTSMAALKTKTATLGAPKVEGSDPVASKDVPALYFGATKMNKNGGTATVFVKSGDEYVRVATNVKKEDGSRAVGTILDPNGPAIAMIKKGEAYYGEATILGKPYLTGYDPIKDASGTVIGIYYVGYMK